MAPTATDIEVSPASKRSGVVFNKCAVSYKGGHISDGLFNEDPKTSTATNVDVVVESEGDLLAGNVLWKMGTVVPEHAASDVNDRPGSSGSHVSL